MRRPRHSLKRYSAVVVCALATLGGLALCVWLAIASHYKFALGAFAVALAALGFGWQEWLEERRFSKSLQRPPFTTTQSAKEP